MALVACMRKLLTILHAMLQHMPCFNIRHRGLSWLSAVDIQDGCFVDQNTHALIHMPFKKPCRRVSHMTCVTPREITNSMSLGIGRMGEAYLRDLGIEK